MKNKFNINESFSEVVKKIRTEANLSQREFAKKLGVSNALISRVEDGIVKKPSFEFLIALSKNFNVDIIPLILCTGHKYPYTNALNRLLVSTNLSEEEIEKVLSIDNEEFEEEVTYIDITKVLNLYKEEKLSLETAKTILTNLDFYDFFINEHK